MVGIGIFSSSVACKKFGSFSFKRSGAKKVHPAGNILMNAALHTARPQGLQEMVWSTPA
jgi:hypothetical protein